MDNQEFDKILADQLRKTQSFERVESDWEHITGQLHTPTKKKKRGFWFFFSPFAFLLLTSTIIGLFYQLNKTNQQLNELQQSLHQLDLINHDTIHKTVTVVKYDTIVQTIRIVHNEEKRFNSSNSQQRHFANTESTKHGNHLRQNTYPKSIPTQDFSILNQQVSTQKTTWPFSTENPEISAQISDNKNNRNASLSMDKVSTTVQANSLNMSIAVAPRSLIAYCNKLDIPPSIKKTNRPLFDLNKVAVGVAIGWSSLGRHTSVNESYDSEFIKKRGWDIGLRLNYQFTSRIIAFADIAFQKFRYQTNLADSIWGVTSMASELVDGSITTEGATIQQQAIHYRLGLNYFLLKHNRWQPFIGLSLEAQSNLKQELSTTYVQEYQLIDSTQVTHNNTFQLQSIVPAVGLKINLSKQISWQSEVWYQQKIWTDPERMYTPFGIRSNLSFHF